MKRLSSLLLFSLLACQARESSADIDALVAEFETGISAGIQIQGEPLVTETIQQRLEHHGVPAVSVAVLNDGAIEKVALFHRSAERKRQH